ncbi:hypothetical protein F5879DRAFT_793171 [Lentinula edodes]|nr:hypothetical protein F5879DRAFT_793171 [Lentinula edodes]KAJ3918316.1 hypothetical protein F5877DRAFT_42830 [Lentinula edodes]
MPSSHASIDDLSSEISYDSEEEYHLAQREWEESLHQLQQILSAVLLPFVGKWLGRRWSYWAYARYLRLGLGKAFVFEK